MSRKVLILAMAFLLLLSGCSASTPEASSNPSSSAIEALTHNIPDDHLQKIKNAVGSLFDGIYDYTASVSEYEGGVDISLSMEGGMLNETFADFVVYGSKAAADALKETGDPLYKFTVTFNIGSNGNDGRAGLMNWSSKDLKTGILVDSTKGQKILKTDATPEYISKAYGTNQSPD